MFWLIVVKVAMVGCLLFVVCFVVDREREGMTGRITHHLS
jgi:hypothetical protein